MLKKLLKTSGKNQIIDKKYTEMDLLLGNLSEKDKIKMIIDRILENNNINATCINIIDNRSSSVYEYKLESYSIKFNKIKNLADTFKMYLQTDSIIIEPAKTTSGFSISISKKAKEILRLGDCFNSADIYGTIIPVGKDIYNNTITTDLTKLPHLMICGTTGSGKSVCLNGIITTLLINNKPEQVQFVLIDPKQIEFTKYAKLKQFCQLGVNSDPNIISNILYQLCLLMDRRYNILKSNNCLNIDDYNLKCYPKFYKIFVIIDELADLMILNKKNIENSLYRLAQMGRACGIHLILATQRPSREVVTGLLKVNIPAKICFKVPSATNSRIVLDQTGAENLSGNGDGIWLDGKSTELIRFQSPLITNEEINNIINELYKDYGTF